MKYLILCVALALASCKDCNNLYDTTPDQGKCWKECATSAAGARSYDYEYNFIKCLNMACGYTHRVVCK